MPSDPKPSLTVLVLGFNQERFVKKAVQSAFDQTFTPLEIILSDDASSDGTFRIMQQMAAAYRGPHEVQCRCNPTNLGTNAHLNTLNDIAKSDRVMCIAGDDIALPERAGRVVAAFDERDAWLIHSDADAINSSGQIVESREFDAATLRHPYRLEEVALSQGLYLGATVAFHRDLFRKYGPLPETPAYEDLVLGFRAALEDRIVYLDEVLIQYRVDTGVSVKMESPTDVAAWRKFRQRVLDREVAVYQQRLEDADRFGLERSHRVYKSILSRLCQTIARKDFHALGFMQGPQAFGTKFTAAVSEVIRRVKRR